MSRKSDKEKLKRLMAREAPVSQPAAPPTVNLDYMKAATVTIGEFKNIQIVIAGNGGIGAYVVMHVGRLMRVLYDRVKGVNLTLCDPDKVGRENLGRQLFCEAEVGEYKAVALARRYSGAWGLNVIAHVGEFNESLLLHEASDLNIIVGCVDNTEGRRAMSAALWHNPPEVGPRVQPKYWWLDCGNQKDTGRVLLGTQPTAHQCRGIITPDCKRVLALPSPVLQSPDLIIPQRDEVDRREMSCAELQMANLQSLNINDAVAIQAADMLTRLLVTRNLKRYQCAINMASGSVKSAYCTPDEIAGEINRNRDFVIRKEGPTFDRDLVAGAVNEIGERAGFRGGRLVGV